MTKAQLRALTPDDMLLLAGPWLSTEDYQTIQALEWHIPGSEEPAPERHYAQLLDAVCGFVPAEA